MCTYVHFGPFWQLSGSGSTFYRSGYANGNSDGLVLMQTVSGVAVDDGRGLMACVPPGRYPAGSEVVVESKHVVDKPRSLDWERAAMLPFLVRGEDSLRGVSHTFASTPLRYAGTVYSRGVVVVTAHLSRRAFVSLLLLLLPGAQTETNLV